MDDADFAKNLLLGKETFSVKQNDESIKFFMRYTNENKKLCENYLKQIGKFITALFRGKELWYNFDNPYGDSIMLFEIRSKNHISNIIGRWEYFQEFNDLKKE